MSSHYLLLFRLEASKALPTLAIMVKHPPPICLRITDQSSPPSGFSPGPTHRVVRVAFFSERHSAVAVGLARAMLLGAHRFST